MALCYKKYTQRRLFYGRHRKRDVADRQASAIFERSRKRRS